MNELNICMLSNLQEYVSSYGLPKVEIRGLAVTYESELKALPGKPMPFFKEHRKSKNTYFSRYGGTWVDKLNNYYSVSKFCCISDLVRFMVKEGDKVMKVSVHEDGF